MHFGKGNTIMYRSLLVRFFTKFVFLMVFLLLSAAGVADKVPADYAKALKIYPNHVEMHFYFPIKYVSFLSKEHAIVIKPTSDFIAYTAKPPYQINGKLRLQYFLQNWSHAIYPMSSRAYMIYQGQQIQIKKILGCHQLIISYL